MPSFQSLKQWNNNRDKNLIQGIYELVLLLGIAVFSYGLLGYVISGAYARYVQDDYCYATILGRQGFWEGQIRSFMEETTYNGNRFSLTFLMGLSERLGRITVGVLPGLAIVLWVAGFVIVLRNASRSFNFPLSWAEIFFIAEALIFLILFQSPNLAQVLYWRPGMLPYLAPLIAQTFLLALILGETHHGHTRGAALAGIAVLAIFGAGFSETAAAFQTGLFAIILTTSFWGMRVKKEKAGQAFHPAWAALFGSMLGMLLLIVSPAGKRLQAMHYAPPQDLMSVLAISLDSVSYFIKYTLYRVTVPTYFTFIFFMALGFLALANRNIPPLLFRPVVKFILISAASIFLLLICITAPSAYVQAGYPELRAMIGARLLIVVWLAVFGCLCGLIARRLVVQESLGMVYTGIAGMLLATLIFWIFLIVPDSSPIPTYPEMRAYAASSPLSFIFAPFIGLMGGISARLFFKRFFPGKLVFELFLIVLFAGLLLQPLKTSQTVYAEIPYYQKRAEIWDQRDAEIRMAEEDGQRNIQVKAIDSLSGISELQENPGNWINRCAAWLYGMETISAIYK